MVCERCNQPFALSEKFCGNCGVPRPRLPQLFEEAEIQFKQLKYFFQSGDLSEQQFRQALESLVILHADGSRWMIGFESESWYRHDGETWVPSAPPTQEAASPSGLAPAANLSQLPVRQKPFRMSRVAPILFVLLFVGVFLAWRLFHGEAVIPVLQSLFSNRSEASLTTPPITPIDKWVVVEVPQFGLSFTQPQNYQQEYNPDDRLLWIQDPNPEQALSLVINFGRMPGTRDPEVYLQDLMVSLPDYQWNGIKRTHLPLGWMVWSEAQSDSDTPIFLAVFGPLKDETMLVFEGQHYTADWNQARDFYFQVIESFLYLN